MSELMSAGLSAALAADGPKMVALEACATW